MDFDYFYNREAERFNFLKVPEILVDGEEFTGLSAEAIILYSMLLKRTGTKTIKKIGKVTYEVIVHFNENATETMQDKLKRIMLREMEREKDKKPHKND